MPEISNGNPTGNAGLRRLRGLPALIVGWAMAALVHAAQAEPIDYDTQIQPLFDRYCVACHACFDAPCQLNLTHPEGLTRGATKASVYNSRRIQTAPPTRLFIDADSTAGWRAKGFYSVIEPVGEGPSTLARLLKSSATSPVVQPLPDALKPAIGRRHECPDPSEIADYTDDHPHTGMPLSFPAMSAEEAARIEAWLDQGAPIEHRPPTLSASEQQQVARWEAWLNGTSLKQALVSRWLYEHWYYARLYFDQGASGRFFRIVRSATPPGQPPVEIATRRPNDDPGRPFHYRLQVIQGTRVYKTHITFALDDALLRHTQQLFFDTPWQIDRLPGYGPADQSNPFATFAAIPPRARYQFMLDHGEYFVRTFIRGPVCRGQIATAVIRDHFWVAFQSPDTDPFIVDARFRQQAQPLLDLPGVEEDLLDGAKQWFDAAGDRNAFVRLRQQALATLAPRGPGLETVWGGEGHNPNALLTVFRHHDSASVKRGWLGQYPQTLWLLDYPLLERSYYNLVVNFDVFGTLSHQAQTRLYFDLIRNGAELNFLRLLPPAARQQELNAWYEGSGQLKVWVAYQSIDTRSPTRIPLTDENPKRQLLTRLLKRFEGINATPDPVNRRAGKHLTPTEALLSTLSGVAAAKMPAIKHLPNAAILKLALPDGDQAVYTLVRNRHHTNVAFILGESLRYQTDRDSLTLVEGIATSYPNFIFHVPLDDLGTFVATLRDKELASDKAFKRDLVDRWGITRSHPAFWDHFHDLNRYLRETDPVQAGMLDIYRYQDFESSSFRPLQSIGILE